MTMFKHMEENLTNSVPPDFSDKSSECEQNAWYAVEEVREHRKRGKRDEYFVKWEGFPSPENTWEKADDVTDDLIEAFLSNVSDSNNINKVTKGNSDNLASRCSQRRKLELCALEMHLD